MGVYTRFKKNPSGFRALVELLESTPLSRRQKMIEVGMTEDPEYTEKAVSYMMTWEDVKNLPDLELAEVISQTPPRIAGYALNGSPEDLKMRFMRNAQPTVMAQIKDYIDVKITPRDVSGAQIKMAECARKLEKSGRLKTKKVPDQI